MKVNGKILLASVFVMTLSACSSLEQPTGIISAPEPATTNTQTDHKLKSQEQETQNTDVEISITPLEEHELFEEQIIEIEAIFSKAPQELKKLTEGVTITGYSRFFYAQNGITVGQFLFHKMVGKRASQEMDIRKFNGNFFLLQPSLSPDKSYPISVPKAELIELLTQIQE